MPHKHANSEVPAAFQAFMQQITDAPHLPDWTKELTTVSQPVLYRLLSQPQSEPEVAKLVDACLQEAIRYRVFALILPLLQQTSELTELHIDPAVVQQNLNLLAKHYLIRALNEDVKQTRTVLDAQHFPTQAETDLIRYHQHWLAHFTRELLQIVENDQIPPIADRDNHEFPLEAGLCPLSHTLKTLSTTYLPMDNPIPEIEQIHYTLHIQIQILDHLLSHKGFCSTALEVYNELKIQSAKLENILNIGVLNKTLINLLQDPLTHLPNWQQLQQDLKSQPPAKFALLNIRGFSDYNLTFGLPMGDKILLVTGQVLSSLERKIEQAYHLYADIFALFLPKDQTIDYLQLVQTIQDQLNAQTSQEFHIELYLSYCEHCHDPLSKAQYGLIEAKKLQQTAVDASTIGQDWMTTIQKHLSWKQKVEMAINDGRLIAVYQPLLNLHSNKVDKYECLMRIENEDSSLASPAEFMPVLEKMFLYHEGTARMLQFAFHTFSQRPEQFSINLSHTDIKNPNLLPMLERLANTYPDTAQKCVFEFLETEELIESKSFSTFLQQCKNLNIQTAIDDFGSGYSNFRYLFSLPIDYIKLDGSLTQNMHDPKIYTLCAHTTKMAHEMGIQVVAEFVSNGDILDKVRSLEVDYAQGYEIGRPEKKLLMPQIFS